MNSKQIQNIALIFQLLSNNYRLQIMYLCLGKSFSVNDLVKQLKISQSLVSHHLKKLRELKLIEATRQGRQIIYEVHDEKIRCILRDMLVYAKRLEPI